jgi:hypothetical protein
LETRTARAGAAVGVLHAEWLPFHPRLGMPSQMSFKLEFTSLDSFRPFLHDDVGEIEDGIKNVRISTQLFSLQPSTY